MSAYLMDEQPLSKAAESRNVPNSFFIRDLIKTAPAQPLPFRRLSLNRMSSKTKAALLKRKHAADKAPDTAR